MHKGFGLDKMERVEGAELQEQEMQGAKPRPGQAVKVRNSEVVSEKSKISAITTCKNYAHKLIVVLHYY